MDTLAPTPTNFRALPVLAAPASVDREKGLIRGASAIQAVEALGHDMLIDEITLFQTSKLGNEASAGIKMRFTHPGMCDDALGKMVGRATNFRIAGDKVLVDVQLNDASAVSPQGDLRDYILTLAEEDPEAFGLSIAFINRPVYKFADGSERDASDFAEVPKDAVEGKPFARIEKLRAVDFVDEPAANRDGLFSAAFTNTTGEAAEAVFSQLDSMREALGLSLDDCHAFAVRYLNARGWQATQMAAPVAGNKEGLSTMEITADQLAGLLKDHAEFSEVILGEYDAGKSEAAILEAVHAAKEAQREAALSQVTADFEAYKAQADADKAEADEQIEALKAQIDTLNKELSEARDLGGSPVDPGLDAGADDGKTMSEAAFAELNKTNPTACAQFIKDGGRVVADD